MAAAEHEPLVSEREYLADAESNASISDSKTLSSRSHNERRLNSRLPHWLNVLWNGPAEPRELHVTMIFPKLQTLPARLTQNPSKKLVGALLLLLWGSWMIINIIMAQHNIFAVVCADEIGTPIKPDAETSLDGIPGTCAQASVALMCGTNPFFEDPLSGCSLELEQCTGGAIEVGRLFSFRCPPNCQREGQTWRHWPVGERDLMHEPVVVGGGTAIDVEKRASLQARRSAKRSAKRSIKRDDDKDSDEEGEDDGEASEHEELVDQSHLGDDDLIDDEIDETERAPGVYRGDSFICAAALHAGLISRYTGGCGQLEWLGPHTGFRSVPSVDSRFASVAFDAEFPVNFRFVGGGEVSAAGGGATLASADAYRRYGHQHGCRDFRGAQILVNVVYILVAAYFITSPALFLGTLGTFGFWTVALASNPPWLAGTSELNGEFVSAAMGRYLPFILGLVYVYAFATKLQLSRMPASFSRMLFWGGGYTVGVLENFVFGALPIDRLIVSDLNSQPGAWLALFIILGSVMAIVVGQAYAFWLENKFRRYLKAYLLGIAGVLALAMWPGQTLRLHHYIFALLLLPGTSLRTTPSLFYQGLLAGLYTAGVSRWNFDSILETTLSLGRGDRMGGASDPVFMEPAQTQPWVLRWSGQPSKEFNGYAVVVNDAQVDVFAAEEMGDTHSYALDIDTDDTTYVRVAAAALGVWPPQIAKYSPPMVLNTDGTFRIVE